MELEQLKEFFGIKKVNEMMENGEIVEDNTVVVDKDGNFVGINDDTLDKDVVILDENVNLVKNLAGTKLAEETYIPIISLCTMEKYIITGITVVWQTRRFA